MQYFDDNNKLHVEPFSKHWALSARRIAWYNSAHCVFLKVSDNNLLSIVVQQETIFGNIDENKAIKSTKTRLLKNAWFPRFCLVLRSFFPEVHARAKPRALPVRPPRETRGRCAYDSRRYCILFCIYLLYSNLCSCFEKRCSMNT